MDWYCVHTKPLREPQVAEHLRQTLGLEVYLPKLKRVKRIRRVRRTVITPLFPRYEFCCFNAGDSLRAVRYAPDVIDIVSFGGTPKAVPDSIIDELREWAGDLLDFRELSPQFKPGERVTLVDGPLLGLEAVIVKDLPDQARVALLLDTLGCGAHSIVDRTHVQRIA